MCTVAPSYPRSIAENRECSSWGDPTVRLLVCSEPCWNSSFSIQKSSIWILNGQDHLIIRAENDGFALMMTNSVFKMMNYALKMMNSVFKMMNSVFKMMNSVFKMMNSVGDSISIEEIRIFDVERCWFSIVECWFYIKECWFYIVECWFL